jgi:hypothetical protein
MMTLGAVSRVVTARCKNKHWRKEDDDTGSSISRGHRTLYE